MKSVRHVFLAMFLIGTFLTMFVDMIVVLECQKIAKSLAWDGILITVFIQSGLLLVSILLVSVYFGDKLWTSQKEYEQLKCNVIAKDKELTHKIEILESDLFMQVLSEFKTRRDKLTP